MPSALLRGIAAMLLAVTIAPAESLDEFFAEFVAKREKITSIRANFIQENITPDETLRSAGRIAYAKPRQLLFEYYDPKIIYAIDGLRAYQYEEELEQVQVYDVGDSAQADAFFIAFDNDAGRLREAYEVTLLDPEPGDCGVRVLKLVPKAVESVGDEDAPTQPFREIRLFLRAEDFLPCEIRAVNQDDAEVRVSIRDYQPNDADAKASVQFHVPQGTNIIVNEATSEVVGEGGKTLPDTTETSTAPPTQK